MNKLSNLIGQNLQIKTCTNNLIGQLGKSTCTKICIDLYKSKLVQIYINQNLH